MYLIFGLIIFNNQIMVNSINKFNLGGNFVIIAELII